MVVSAPNEDETLSLKFCPNDPGIRSSWNDTVATSISAATAKSGKKKLKKLKAEFNKTAEENQQLKKALSELQGKLSGGNFSPSAGSDCFVKQF